MLKHLIIAVLNHCGLCVFVVLAADQPANNKRLFWKIVWNVVGYLESDILYHQSCLKNNILNCFNIIGNDSVHFLDVVEDLHHVFFDLLPILSNYHLSQAYLLLGWRARAAEPSVSLH